MCYTVVVIKTFRDEGTEDLFNGLTSRDARRTPQDIWNVARRKLDMVNAAHALQDLRVPPANRLEALKGDRKGFFSIRINDQFRVVFRWVDGDAYDVQIVDYH
jgi:proteic killer suppression protein